MLRTFLLRCWLCVVLAETLPPVSAATGQSASSPLRYLFLVETTGAMMEHRSLIGEAMAARLRNGLNGQMSSEEMFSIWTFDQRVWTDRYWPATWNPRAREVLATSVIRFWEEQSFGNAARLDLAIDHVMKLIATSDAITVLLISSDATEMRGTLFDAKINAAYREAGRANTAGTPFLTTLLARDGQVIAWSVEPLLPNSRGPDTTLAVQKRPSRKKPVWTREPDSSSKRMAVRRPEPVDEAMRAAPEPIWHKPPDVLPADTNQEPAHGIVLGNQQSAIQADASAGAIPALLEIGAPTTAGTPADPAVTGSPVVPPSSADRTELLPVDPPNLPATPENSAPDSNPPGTRGRSEAPVLQSPLVTEESVSASSELNSVVPRPEPAQRPAGKSSPPMAPAIPDFVTSSEQLKSRGPGQVLSAAETSRDQVRPGLSDRGASDAAESGGPIAPLAQIATDAQVGTNTLAGQERRKGGLSAQAFLFIGITLLVFGGLSLAGFLRKKRANTSSSFISQSLDARK